MIRTLIVDDEPYAREELAELLPLLYGGSVKPDNLEQYLAQPDIDGALIGGASLVAADFLAIATAAAA